MSAHISGQDFSGLILLDRLILMGKNMGIDELNSRKTAYDIYEEMMTQNFKQSAEYAKSVIAKYETLNPLTV